MQAALTDMVRRELLLSDTVFGLARLDPVVVAVGAAVVLVVCAAACLAPSARAPRADPLAVLREG